MRVLRHHRKKKIGYWKDKVHYVKFFSDSTNTYIYIYVRVHARTHNNKFHKHLSTLKLHQYEKRSVGEEMCGDLKVSGDAVLKKSGSRWLGSRKHNGVNCCLIETAK